MRTLFKKGILLLSAMIVASGFSAFAVSPRAGVMRVKLKPEAVREIGVNAHMRTNGKVSTGSQSIDLAVNAISAVSIRPMLPYSEKFAAARAEFGLDQWYIVTFDANVPVAQAERILRNAEGVQRAEKIVPMSLQEGRNSFKAIDKNLAKAPAQAANKMPFNDPLLSKQWHYQNFGTIPNSVAGADINLFEGWKTTTGSSDVIVAIIDGGVDYTHEDLAANMYVNEAELNGLPGVDDDKDGYTDNIYGFNFCTGEGLIYPHSHGTHVAGTVAAVNNNNIGVGGVAGGDGTPGSGIRLMSCQVFDSRSGAGEGDFAEALIYAAEHGATIAQCSWGWDSPGYYEQAVLDAIDYFTAVAQSDKMKGGLAIFALGNTGDEGDYYPGSYPKVVAVTSMTAELTPASYSSRSVNADIVAPGGLLDYDEAQGVLSTLPNNEYGYSEGTSMATPHVSGVAALVVSKYGNPTFLNENLRTQLITSVNDFYGFGNNSSVEGLFGSGYLDAGKALVMDQSSYPEAVSDFELQASQDNINISWTVPESSEHTVASHIIYYSKSAFDASSDLTTLPSLIVDTRFLNSGDTATAELEGLENLTTYYIAIQAVNRWGNAAALSPVKSISTNAGPKLEVTTSYLSIETSADAPNGSTTMTIANNGEGLLKWESATRTVSVSPYSVVRPNPGKVKAFDGTLASTSAIQKATTAKAEYVASEYPKEIYYYNELWAMIGESDRSIPNSLAQFFRVDANTYPEGFNLTHLYFEGTVGGENPIIEIYRGDATISKATLITTVDYYFFTYNYDIQLNEQLWFAPGEAFWVVAHFEGNQERYPLPMAKTDLENVSNTAYMSNDKGESWSQLSAALAGSVYESIANEVVWAVKARSHNPDWSSYLELDPTSGTVRQGETQDVAISVDGSKLVNGNYNLKVLLSSNETGAKQTSVPLTLNVSGNKPSINVPKVVDFGSLLVGETKTVYAEVYNSGYGSFSGSQWGPALTEENVTSNSDQFSGPDYIGSGFPARTKSTIALTYTPTTAGSHNGVITFKDYNGNEARILVQGTATEPAKLTVEPAVINADTIVSGAEAIEKTFTVTNTGKYPLEFVFPRYSDKTIEGAAKLHRYGYSVSSTLEGFTPFAYEEPTEILNATDITSKFNDNVYVSSAIDLGFTFPYYGKNYDRVYITSFGGVMFAQNETSFRTPLDETSYGVPGTGLISAYGSQCAMGPDSHIEYGFVNGKFVVNFRNVLAVVYSTEYAPVSFRIILSPNGDIEMYYDDYVAANFFQAGSSLFCGITDPEVNDCVVITSNQMSDYWGIEEPTPENTRFRDFGTGTAVLFEAPHTSFVDALVPAYGLLAPGESAEVKATISVNENMNAGETYNNLAIVSNDPKPAISAVRINAIVSNQGMTPELTLNSTNVNFGEVFRTATLTIPVTVKNTGRDVLELTSATFGTEKLSVSNTLPISIKAGQAVDLLVNVNTDVEGEITDKLTITSNTGNTEVDFNGTVIGTPVAEFSLTAITETVESGTPLTKALTVSNTGNEPLTYTMLGDQNSAVTVPDKDDTKVSYSYAAASDGKATFNWIDIETNGLGEQHTYRYYDQHDFIAVDLPFEFPFYGKKYNRMFIYNTGFVSFTERKDDRIWPEPPGNFPKETLFTNIIAPYWGLHSMNTTKTAGTFHYVTENQAVVSFMEYGNSMNIGVCFQLILNADGSFKFQYKGFDSNAELMNAFGLAGISNEDGSEYVRLPERHIRFGEAVDFIPVRLNTLAPGETDDITVALNTNHLAGNYQSSIAVSTNEPNATLTSIPVDLTITGTAKPIIPDSVSITQVMGYQCTSYDDPAVIMGGAYSAVFEIANEGTAPLTVVSVRYDSPMYQEEFFGEIYEEPAFSLLGNLYMEDWFTGEMTKGWTMVDPEFFNPVEVGTESLQLAVGMMQTEYWMTPGEYNVPVYVEYTTDIESGETVTDTINVNFTVTPMPMMYFEEEEIRVEGALDSDVSVHTLSITNEGEYKLDYELTIDLTGVGAEEDFGDGGIAPANYAARSAAVRALAEKTENLELKKGKFSKIHPMDNDNSLYNVPNNFEYRRALYYDALAGNNTSYNYGTFTKVDEYKASVHFTAPENGFNISHIYLPVFTEGKKNITVKFTIVSGDDPEDGEVIGTGSLFIEKQSSAQSGQFYVVPLDKPVYVTPNEDFCVIVSYPAGLQYPAYLCVKEEPVTDGRYLGWIESAGWVDIAQLLYDNYGSLGYILSCLETEEGSDWVTILNPETSGSIEPFDVEDIQIQINPAAARKTRDNKAVLIIRSNDPQMPVFNFPIWLSKNAAPELIAASIIEVNENDKANAGVFLTEIDNEVVTVAIDDPLNIAYFQESDSAEVSNEITVQGTEIAKALPVVLAPKFGDEGDHTFTVTATDAAGLTTSLIVAYTVNHTNQAPVASEINGVELTEGSFSQPLDFSTLFTDPDGDDMTFAFNLAANEVVDAYFSGSSVVFLGKKVGTVTATITATDSNGDATVAELPITVKELSGLNNIEINDGIVTLVENPASEEIRLLAAISGKATADLFTAAGVNVFSTEVELNEGSVTTLPATYAPGHYILIVRTAEGNAIIRVIIR